MQNPLASALSSVTFGTPITRNNLTMIPLVGPSTVEQPPFYVSLDEALALGWTEITEISEQGSVPELRVINKGAKPVLILDGEELLGAKQNRVVNLTILVPAATTLTIPVSCVEAGRWRSKSRSFAAAPRMQYAEGRGKRMAQVTASMQMNQSYASDQAEVWADIAAKSARFAVRSRTSAMEDIFVQQSTSVEEFVGAVHPVDGQVGALFLIDGDVVGFDLFDRATTLRRLLPKMVRSVALDALDRPADGHRHVKPELELSIAGHFLEKVVASPTHEGAAAGAGRDIRIVGHGLTGGALVVDDAAVHISAFRLH